MQTDVQPQKSQNWLVRYLAQIFDVTDLLPMAIIIHDVESLCHLEKPAAINDC